MQQNVINQRKIVFIFTALVVLTVLIVVIQYVATHGIVKVSKASGTEYVLIPVEGGSYADAEKYKSEQQVVKSGEYILESRDGASMQQKNITVPSWLQTVTASISTVAQQNVKQVASGTLPNITKDASGNIISFSSNGSTQTTFIHTANDPTGTSVSFGNISPSSSFGAVTSGRLVAFQNDSEIPYPYLYGRDFFQPPTRLISNTTEKIPNVVPTAVANDGHFGLSYPIDNAYIDVYNDAQFIKRVSLDKGYAKSTEGRTIASVGGEFVAIGYGNNSTEIEGDEYEDETNPNVDSNRDYVVKIYQLSSPTISEVSLGRGVSVNGLSISANGSRLAVEKNGRLEIYDTSSKKRLFMYEGTSFKTPTWVGDDTLIFSDQLGGMLAYHDKQKEVTSLFGPDILTINSFTVQDNTVLFTATRTKESGGVRADLQGYELDLTAKSPSANKLLSALPYEGQGVKIATVNNIIYASPTGFFRPPPNTEGAGFYEGNVSESVRQKVTSYLRKNIPDYTSYKIVYGFNL